MAYLNDLKAFDLPILLGISRKSIIGKSLDLPVDQREEATVALNVLGRAAGARIFRVHNVLANKRALAMTDVIRQEIEG
jgi:dihydropteroate synthase